MSEAAPAPKLFISYSWSNSTHEQAVVSLAADLRGSGVDVIFDKWDLKEGHDSVAFMEQMVTDPEIKKVAIITDEIYAEKADGRKGGVGTETQIISQEVYEKQDQNKFVAVVFENDEDGKPYLPTYCKSRIYINLSDQEFYSDEFDKLLRWIFDKPLHVKPELGKRPNFLDDNDSISLGTTVAYKRVDNAIKENKANASSLLEEYLDIFSQNLERFRLKDVKGDIDDAIVKNIDEFIPHRNELIKLFFTVARYAPTKQNILMLHSFFEKLMPYMSMPPDVQQYDLIELDNFKFIIHELFLYLIAVLLKCEKFRSVNDILSKQYYLHGNVYYGNEDMVGFNVFREHLKSLAWRKEKLKKHCYSLHADMLKDRMKGTNIDFRDLMQADFVAFVRAGKESEKNRAWWPITLCYIVHRQYRFEIFARSASKQYFDKVKCILAIDNIDDLDKHIELRNKDHDGIPNWGGYALDLKGLFGFDRLATKE